MATMSAPTNLPPRLHRRRQHLRLFSIRFGRLLRHRCWRTCTFFRRICWRRAAHTLLLFRSHNWSRDHALRIHLGLDLVELRAEVLVLILQPFSLRILTAEIASESTALISFSQQLKLKLQHWLQDSGRNQTVFVFQIIFVITLKRRSRSSRRLCSRRLCRIRICNLSKILSSLSDSQPKIWEY